MQTMQQDELAQFQADHRWIEEHRTTLLGQYPDQWIAVKGRRVIAADADLDRLLGKLPDCARTCVEFLGHEPLEMIL
jgi:hypothetical protein